MAYKKGNSAVLDELSKAGAAVAPDNIFHKRMIVKSEYSYYSYMDYVDAACFDANNGASLFRYLPQVQQWEKADSTPEAKVVCGDQNPWEETLGDASESVKLWRYYKRTGLNTADIFAEESYSPGTASCSIRYHLEFATPTHGTFWRVIQSRNSMDIDTGKFWLENAPEEPSTQGGKRK